MSTLEGAIILAVLLVLYGFAYRLFRSSLAPKVVQYETVGDAVALLFTAGVATGIVMISIHAQSDGLVWDLVAGSVVMAAIVTMFWLVARTKSSARMPDFAPFTSETPAGGGVDAAAANSNRRKAGRSRAA